MQNMTYTLCWVYRPIINDYLKCHAPKVAHKQKKALKALSHSTTQWVKKWNHAVTIINTLTTPLDSPYQTDAHGHTLHKFTTEVKGFSSNPSGGLALRKVMLRIFGKLRLHPPPVFMLCKLSLWLEKYTILHAALHLYRRVIRTKNWFEETIFS